jgi:hypothetical protein
MTMATRNEVIIEELKGYLKASKEGKGVILDRLEVTLKMHRKALVRRFKNLQTREEGWNWQDHRGRPEYYTPDCVAALKEIWEIAHEICAERLHEVLEEYIAILQRDKMWKYSDVTTGKLRAMSLGLMKKKVGNFTRIVSGGGRCMTKPSSLKEVIPVRRGPWENPDPGIGEIDTVAHCGGTLGGEFAYTVQYTDISLTWVLLQAQMGKDKHATLQSIQAMCKRFPDKVTGLDPDSGSEFINWHLKDWCDKKNIFLSRIRPGMKNDHGRIEQKNDKNIRNFSGYIRIDTQGKAKELQDLYEVLEVYINHFLPSMKCVEKIRYNIHHSSRKYDRAKTPYRRLMEHSKISAEVKKKMFTLHQKLNPKTLHDEILKRRKILFKNAKFTRDDIL